MTKKHLSLLLFLAILLGNFQLGLALAADQLPPSLNDLANPIVTPAVTTTDATVKTTTTSLDANAITTTSASQTATPTTPATTSDSSKPAFEDFKDVSITRPDYNAIIVLRYQKVLEGYPDNTFHPDQLLNRVEALKMIFEVAKIDLNTGIAPAVFKDTEKNTWYTGYLNKALFLEVVGGYPDGTFKPTQPVNLVEFLKMLETAQKVDLTNTNLNQLAFADIRPGEWYTKYINYAKINALVDADQDNKVFPDKSITRGRAAEIIYRFRNLKNRPQSSTTSVPPTTIPPKATLLTEKDYALYVSASYKFAIQYPKNWFYASLLADGKTVIRNYGFGPKDLATNAALVNLELLPDNKDFAPNLVYKTLIYLKETAKDGNIILSTKIDGSTRIYRLTGPAEQETVMLTMLSSLTTSIEGLESNNPAEKAAVSTTTTTTDTSATTFSTTTAVSPTP